MAGIVRKNLRLGGVFGALALLAACGGDNASSKQGGSFPLAGSSSQIGWPTEDPSFRNDGNYVADAGGSGGSAVPDNWQPLRAARPMVASSGSRYDYAPSYDYRDDGPVYYDDRPNDDSYAWLGLASTLGDTFGNAPPDYYFDYGDVEPWVWETDDHYVRYAEPLDDGYRYYYYEPHATRPYLIRDPDYSYGYRDDRLVVIYDDNGRVLDGRRAWGQSRAAANYYARARSLHQHWQDSPRYGVSAPLWNSRRDIVSREQRQWDRARDRQNGWRNWDSRNEGSIGSRWAGERAARQYAAQRFDGWRRDDYRGVAPRFNVEARQAAPVRQAALRQEAIRNVRDRAEFRTAALQEDRSGGRGSWRNGGSEAILAGRHDQQRQQAFFDRATNQRDNRGGAQDRQAQLRPRIEQRRDTAQRSAFFANQSDGAREQGLRNRAIQSRDNQGRSDMRERFLAQRQSITRGQDDARRQAQASQAQASQAQDRRSTFAQRRAEAQQRVQQGGDRSRLIEQRQTAMRDRASQNQQEGRQRMLEQRQSQMRQRQQQVQQNQVEGRQRMIEQRQAQMQQRQAEGRQQMMRQRQEQVQQRQGEGRQRMMEQRQSQTQQRVQEAQQRQAEGGQRMMEQRQSQTQQRVQEAQQRQAEGRQQMMQQRQAQMQQRQQEMQQRASQRQAGPQQRPESRRPDNGNR